MKYTTTTRSLLCGLVLAIACDDGGEQVAQDTGTDTDGGTHQLTHGTSMHSNSDTSSTGTSSDITGDSTGSTGSDGENETSELVPEPPGGRLRFPADAVDIDPDPHVVTVELVATPYRYAVGDRIVEGFAYNGQVPGPTIRMQKGQKLRVLFTSQLDAPTTIHWHGLHVPFAMDGVAWKGSPILPGSSFVYEFEVDQEGTYWYHPHFDTERQVDLGLYGTLVVTDPAHPQPDHDLVFVLDTWGEWEDEVITPHRQSDDADHAHGRLGKVQWTVNGMVEPYFELPAGETVRARFVNVANMGYADLRGIQGIHMGGDQGILAAPSKTSDVMLTPGDRADFEGLLGQFQIQIAQHSLFGPGVDHEPAHREKLLDWRRVGEAATPKLTWPHSGATPSVDPPYTDVVYTFHGDPRTDKWTINGEVFPEVTIFSVPFGHRTIIEVRNLSGSEHPFHIHGHAFEILSVNGKQPLWKTMEDNWNLAIRDRLRIAMDANNVGDWMTHCHILPHADRGMMTVFNVQAPSEP